MERAGVPNEGQGKSFCISVNSRRVSPRAVGREGSFDSVMLRGAPGKRTRRSTNFAVNTRVVTTERVEYRKVMEGLMWLPVERQERVVASSQWHVSVRAANGSVLQGSPVLFVRDVAQGLVGRGFQEVSRGAVNLDAASRRESSCCRCVNFSAGTSCSSCVAGSVAASYCSVAAHSLRARLLSVKKSEGFTSGFPALNSWNSCKTLALMASGMPYTFRCPCVKPRA